MRKKKCVGSYFKLYRYEDYSGNLREEAISKRLTGRHAEYVYHRLLHEHGDTTGAAFLDRPRFRKDRHYRLVVEFHDNGLGFVSVHRER